MKLFLLVFFILVQVSSYAQIDSTDDGIDTIYIKGGPVIIKKEYYLPYESSLTDTWFVSLAYGLGKASDSHRINEKVNYAIISNSVLSIGKLFNNWSFQIGISYLSFNTSSKFSGKYTYQSEKKYTTSDTIDVYTQTVDGVKSYYYVTEPKSVIEKNQEIRDTVISHQFKLSYFQIPAHVQYRFKKEKWFISPGFILQSAFLLNHKAIKNDSQGILKNMVLMSGISLDIGREITKNMKASIYSQCSKNISEYSSEKDFGNLLMITGGIRLNYFF